MRRRVADVMTTAVAAVRETASFKEVARLLKERRVSGVPVVDDGGRVVGVVSEADLLAKAQYPRGQVARPFEGRRRRALRAKAGGSTARELASRPAVVVTSGATVAEAARLAARHQVKRLPVVGAGGELVGIVSRADLLKVFLRSDEEIRAEIAAEIVGDHLWVDPETLVIEVAGGVVTLQGELEQRTDVATLVRLARAVDGVVGVDERVSWRFDDTAKEGRGWRDSDRRRRGPA
jgi:CBS domain-containing protein